MLKLRSYSNSFIILVLQYHQQLQDPKIRTILDESSRSLGLLLDAAHYSLDYPFFLYGREGHQIVVIL